MREFCCSHIECFFNSQHVSRLSMDSRKSLTYSVADLRPALMKSQTPQKDATSNADHEERPMLIINMARSLLQKDKSMMQSLPHTQLTITILILAGFLLSRDHNIRAHFLASSKFGIGLIHLLIHDSDILWGQSGTEYHHTYVFC